MSSLDILPNISITKHMRVRIANMYSGTCILRPPSLTTHCYLWPEFVAQTELFPSKVTCVLRPSINYDQNYYNQTNGCKKQVPVYSRHRLIQPLIIQPTHVN